MEIDTEYAAAQLELDKQRAIRDVAMSLRPLGLDPSRLGATDYTFTTAGVVPTGRISQLEWSLKEVTEDAVAFKQLPLKRGVSVATLSIPIERRDAVERILSDGDLRDRLNRIGEAIRARDGLRVGADAIERVGLNHRTSLA